MTREKQIDELCRLRSDIVNCGGYVIRTNEQMERFAEALSEAIAALQPDPEVEAAKEQKAYNEGFNAFKRIITREKLFNSYCPKCMGKLEPCEDAISRSEAINSLDGLYLDGESAQGYTTDANEDCLIGKYKAIEILDELPSVNTQKWIPCKERLPEEPIWDNYVDPSDSVLVCDKNGHCHVSRYWGHRRNKNYNSDWLDIDKFIDIVAWMPLPEPWKEGDADAGRD